MRILILLFLIFLSSFSAQSASAWCHNMDISMDVMHMANGTSRETHRENYLILKLLHQDKIRYCVSTAVPDTLSEENEALQVEVALQAWLKPLYEMGLKNVTIERSACSDGNIDLKVDVFNQFKGSEGYQDNTEGPYSHVVLEKGSPWVPLVDTISITGKENFAESLVNSKADLRRSSYSLFLHEIGHAFGLAHATLNDAHCKGDFASPTQPDDAAMSPAGGEGHTSLTPDDVNGVQSLYTRFFKSN